MNLFAEPAETEGIGRYIRAFAIGYMIGAILSMTYKLAKLIRFDYR